MEKITFRQFQIMNAVYDQQDYMTAHELSTLLNISVRTVKSEISQINLKLMPAKLILQSRHGKGYRIHKEEGFDEELLQSLYPEQCRIHDNHIPDTYYERVLYIIKKLLVVDYHIKLEELSEELYLSRTTMTQLMKDVRSRLLKYRLEVVSRPNYGILLEGEENDKRLAIAEYFFHATNENDYTLENDQMFLNEDAREEHQKITEMIRSLCGQYDIEISDFSIHNLAIHIHISMRRCVLYNYIKVDEARLVEWQNTIEFKAAAELIHQLEKLYQFLLPLGECVYLAQHLRAKRIIEQNQLSVEAEMKLRNCLTVIINETNNNFALSLKEDSDWYNYMYLHLPQMVQRLRSHMYIRNPLVSDNIRRYLFASKITHSACVIIEQFYQVAIDINEFGYLLLYFNLAITRFETNKPLRIAVLSGRGRPEALMYTNEICERFSSKKYQITEVEKVDNEECFDLIISTYKTHHNLSVPSIIINSDNYLDKIEEKLNELRYHSLDLDVFFKEEYCTFNLDGETQEEVLHQFFETLWKKELIKELPDQYSLPLDDELGNGIVHFQDSYRIVRKSMCYICTLKKPIYWRKSLVRVLILTKTKRDRDKDLYNLCRVVSRWTSDKNKVNNLLRNQSFELLMKDLRSIV